MFYSKPLKFIFKRCHQKLHGSSHRVFILILNFLLLLTNIPLVQSQFSTSYQIESLGTHTDLHTSVFNCLLQDRQGFIWVGTDDGLCRFDGYTFKNFHASDSGRIGRISALAIGPQGDLFMGGENGLFYENQGQIVALPLPLGDGQILTVHVDQEGGFWIGGLSFVPFYLKPGQLETLKAGEEIQPAPVTTETYWLDVLKELRTYAISTDSSGRPYFGTLNRIVVFDGQKLQILHEKPLTALFVHSLKVISSDSIYWGGKHAPFHLWTPQQQWPLTDVRAVEIVQSTGYRFLLTESGIFIAEAGSCHEIIDLSGYSNTWFKDIIMDREGNFWVAGHSDLLKISPTPFTHYIYPEHPFLETNFSIAITPDDQIFVGSHHGQILKKVGNDFTPFFDNNQRIVPRAAVRAIHTTESGEIWFGTAYQGLVLYRNGQLENYTIENGLADNAMYFFEKSPDGALWTGGDGGIAKILMDENGLVSFKNYKAQYISARYPSFQGCVVDHKGNIWAGGDIGLYLLNGDSLWQAPLPQPYATNPSITAISIDRSGNIWFSTQGEGLWQCRVTTEQNLEVIKQWTISDGLASDLWLDLHIDRDQRIWTVNNQGICCLSPQSEDSIRCFDTADGWRKQSSTYMQLYESKDSLLWIAGTGGISTLPLYDLPLNNKQAPVHIEAVSLMGRKEDIYLFSSNPAQKHRLPENLKLPYHKNYLRFHYTATSFRAPAKNQFKYRLLEVDKEWLQDDGGRTATYPGLAPGKYRFEVLAANNDGFWSEQPAYYSFTILAPWWRSGWAYFGYGCLFVGMLIMARRQIIKREELKNQLRVEQLEKEKVQEIDQLRARFFANISHEFRTPLTLIKAPLEDLLTSRKDEADKLSFYQMHQNTERLLQLVNQLLDLSRLESGVLKLQQEPQDIYALLRQLAGNFQSLADQKKLDFRIEVSKKECWLNFDRDKLEKIVLNLLSNAIKFAPEKGWVKMEASFLNTLKIRIGNSGEVIPPEEQNKLFDRFYQAGDARHQGAGIGLSLVRELVDLHLGKAGVESSLEKGTWFWVELPLEKAGKKPDSDAIASSFNAVALINNPPDKHPSQPTKTLPQEDNPVVLLVEDHEEVRTYIKQKLENDYIIIEAEDGEKGLEIALEQLPDLIVSDLMMPKVDGIQLCQSIKEDLRTSHIPFILLTAKADIDSRLDGLKTGADDYLAKPFNSKELLVRIQNLIILRQKLRESFAGTIKLEPQSVKLNSAAHQFLERAIALVEENIENNAFNATKFCKSMLLSRTQLHRKLKNLTGHSTTDFIRNLRLQRAAQLLEAKAAPVTQVAFKVGFSSQSYFTKCFKKKYGVVPSEYGSINDGS